MQRFSLTISSLESKSFGSGRFPLKQVSYILCPMSFWISSIVSFRPLTTKIILNFYINPISLAKGWQSTIFYVPFATAHPLRDSTLKLLVLVGKIRKAITVLSDLDSFNRWFSLANDSMNISAPWNDWKKIMI